MKHNYDEPTMQAAIDAACKITANSTHRPSFALLRLIESNTTDDWPKEQHSRLHLAEKLLELLPEAPPPESKTCSVCNWTNVSLLNLGEPGDPRWVCPGCCKRAFDQTQPPVVGGKTPGQVNHDAVANGDYDTYKKWSELSERGKRDVERGASAVLAAFGKPQLSTLRPISEAGEVPDGCVRYFFRILQCSFSIGTLEQGEDDTHFADILVLVESKIEAPTTEEFIHPGSFDPVAVTKPIHSTFTAHGKEWTPAVGNVVTLKSGSPKMTVTVLSVHKDNASVSWFNDGVVNSASFNVSTLIPA